MPAYAPFDARSRAALALLASWESNPCIRHLCTPTPRGTTEPSGPTVEQLTDRFLGRKGSYFVLNEWILLSGEPVGHCTLLLDPPRCVTPTGPVAWPRIVIGSPTLRRKGLGAQTLTYLEHRAHELGARVIEAGVFEFNAASLHLLRTTGYVEIARIPDVTFWNGRAWADLRFHKPLAPDTHL